jgi:hypothetical protein
MRVCILAFITCFAASAASAEVIDRVLAVVNGDVITLSDVTAARDLGVVNVPGTADDPVRATLDALIDRALELDEVDRYGPPEPAADAIDQGVAAVRSRFSSQAAFDAALSRSGINLQHVRAIIRENLRIQAYLDQRFSAADERRRQLVNEWLVGLRRRAELYDLYTTR